jgi:malate dehydrogenase (oxaloacetate-decarboxylating)
MLDFHLKAKNNNDDYIETSLSGKSLLTIPQLNKGTAFTAEERRTFGLLGKLPFKIETLEEQEKRAYMQYSSYSTRLQQNIYLNNLHDKNQVLFYKLVSMHLEEIMPTIYTPIVGTAVKQFSKEYRQPRGLYISYHDKPYLQEIFKNRTNPNIELIVVTDGEGVLGIGDQGIGGMDIPVAKLMVYTLCGGINPIKTLPIFLDVGTNNEELLNDPMYLGCNHPRIHKEEYDAFIDAFVSEVKIHFPNAFLHWEDFGRDNARRILDTYQDKLCTFNDDIQGTGAVTLAALLSAINVTTLPLSDHRFVVFGAGSAGTGIADQIVDALIRQGMQEKDAYDKFWLIDRQGLVLDSDTSLTEAQKPYAKSKKMMSDAGLSDRSLLAIIQYLKPTVLIGCSAQPGAFNEKIIKEMAKTVERPIIFPLSNPDEKCEAKPSDIINWTKGKALIATGTAFPVIKYKNIEISIAQCNNALVFPGIGLGILVSEAKRLTKEMIYQAALTLSQFSPIKSDPHQPLLPSLSQSKEIAQGIAYAVATAAMKDKVANTIPEDILRDKIKVSFWEPKYIPFKKI